jgi:aminoglycoside 3-N-acetyltransferase I
MSAVFGEGESAVSETCVDRLLQQDTFWAVAAVDEDGVVGGLTAHVLPMTKGEHSELLINDVAVREDRQRQGIGQMLVNWAVKEAFALAMHTVFFLADNDDVDAVRFYKKLDGVASDVMLIA